MQSYPWNWEKQFLVFILKIFPKWVAQKILDQNLKSALYLRKCLNSSLIRLAFWRIRARISPWRKLGAHLMANARTRLVTWSFEFRAACWFQRIHHLDKDLTQITTLSSQNTFFLNSYLWGMKSFDLWISFVLSPLLRNRIDNIQDENCQPISNKFLGLMSKWKISWIK